MLNLSILVSVLLLTLIQTSALKQDRLAPGTYVVNSEIP